MMCSSHCRLRSSFPSLTCIAIRPSDSAWSALSSIWARAVEEFTCAFPDLAADFPRAGSARVPSMAHVASGFVWQQTDVGSHAFWLGIGYTSWFSSQPRPASSQRRLRPGPQQTPFSRGHLTSLNPARNLMASPKLRV
eukprot:CAMPEP_0117648776 /NCGR_PEP_ID=MMETSP0804-20121206/597_1 /TAXON_ID=1074897 /ORGANISM="Tetraselmis astigmatica, Strain CCMP880" /LENGTH=137 /DNA_ID=CAMNT_0005454425 /DNA_START=221 /DNA_END=635 /DNA_ORIENTATION=+